MLGWYANKLAIRRHLEELNKDKQVLEYCLFQPGSYMNFLGYPHKTTKHSGIIKFLFDYENLRALVVEGSLDGDVTFTTVGDIANIVALAVGYEGTWPTVGGITGQRITVRELLGLAESVRGKPFAIDWLKKEDLERGELKTDNYIRVDLPSIPKDQLEHFSKAATEGLLLSSSRGAWTVTDEWNQIFPEYKFTKVEEFLRGLFN